MKLIHFTYMIIGIFFLFGISSCSKKAPAPTAEPEPTKKVEWELVWADEFDGAELDTSKWNFEVTGRGGGNNELQYYTDFTKVTNYKGKEYQPNYYVKDGNLHMVVHETEIAAAINNPWEGKGLMNASYESDFDGEQIAVRQYTSAKINSATKGDFKYARIEGRMTIPSYDGIWPAFWLLPTNWEYGDWPRSGELDIHEWSGKHNPDNIFGTLHWGTPHNYRGHEFPIKREELRDFHTYAIEWEPGEIRWYFDGVHYQTQNKDGQFVLNHETGKMEHKREQRWFTSGKSGNASDCKPAAKFPAPFDKEFHILLNVAVGGNLGGYSTENLTGKLTSGISFPQEMVVDYVRVYQAKGGFQEKTEEPRPAEKCIPKDDIIVRKVPDKDGNFGEGRELTYIATKGAAQYYLQTKDSPQDFTKYSTMKFDLNVLEAPSSSMKLDIHCVYPCVGEIDVKDKFAALAGKGWTEMVINVSDLNVPKIENVNTPFLLFTEGTAKIQIANIRYESPDGEVKVITMGTEDAFKPVIMGNFNNWSEIKVE